MQKCHFTLYIYHPERLIALICLKHLRYMMKSLYRFHRNSVDVQVQIYRVTGNGQMHLFNVPTLNAAVPVANDDDDFMRETKKKKKTNQQVLCM